MPMGSGYRNYDKYRNRPVAGSTSHVAPAAGVAEPGVLPPPFGGVVCLGLLVPSLHKQPTHCDDAQADCGLLPVVGQCCRTHINAFTSQQGANRHRHVDQDATDTVGDHERHRRRRCWRRAMLGQRRGLGAVAADLCELPADGAGMIEPDALCAVRMHDRVQLNLGTATRRTLQLRVQPSAPSVSTVQVSVVSPFSVPSVSTPSLVARP